MKTIETKTSKSRAKAILLALFTIGLFAISSRAQPTVVPYTFSTISGVPETNTGYWEDGTNTIARFWQPEGLAIDNMGNIYVADTYNDVIREMMPLGGGIWQVTTIAGQPQIPGYGDATIATNALFNEPEGVAVDNQGNIFVADTGNNVIREISAAGTVVTIAGNSSILFNGAPAPGYMDGAPLQAQFDTPIGIVVDSSGNIFVGDYNNNVIRKLTKAAGVNAWEVSTFAGSVGSIGIGDANGLGNQAQFAGPTGLAIDSAGNLYLADADNNEIRKITPNANVSTLAGFAPTEQQQQNYAFGTPYGNNDSLDGLDASFSFPSAVAVDSSGNVYVADTDNEEIRKISPNGAVTTLGGQPAFAYFSQPPAPLGQYADGAGPAALFSVLSGIAVDNDGNLYVADTGNSLIREGVAPLVQVVAMEVTQAVQDWNNSVKLVQGKDTYLRAHLQLPSSQSTGVMMAGAVLYGTSNGIPLPDSPITPINPGASLNVTTINASNTTVRRDFNQTLNFRIPPEWLYGKINLQLAWAGGLLPANVVQNDTSVDVTFVPAGIPQIKFSDVQWTDTNGTLHQLGDSIHDMRNRVLSCFPAASLNCTYDTLVLPGVQRPDFGVGESFVDMVNAQLNTARKRDYANNLITRRIYHGAIEDYEAFGDATQGTQIAGKAKLPFPSFVSCATVINTWGTGRQSASHELGHNLANQHDVDATLFGTDYITDALTGRTQIALGACTEKGPLGYTYPLFESVDRANGMVKLPALGPFLNTDGTGDNSLIYGLDTFVLQNTTDSPVLSPVEFGYGDLNCYYDLMSYCRNGGLEDLWPSSVTYTALLNQINSTFPPPPSSSSSPMIVRAESGKVAGQHTRGPHPMGGPQGVNYLMVRGMVNFVTAKAQFLPCLPLTTTNTPPSQEAGTNFLLEALNAAGTVIQSVQFALNPDQGEGSITNLVADFSVSLTNDPAIHTLMLSYNGGLLATMVAGSTIPTVTLTSPNGGQTYSSGPINITWTASDADGNALFYTVEYSTDDGETWQTLAVDYQGQSLSLSGSQLAATTKALIRVIATDGLNTATAVSAATFTVQPHPPFISINSPMNGSMVIGDQQLFLAATVEDMQDGDLTGANVQWHSDRNGLIGTGAITHFDPIVLSEGLHTITVTATDSAGLTNSAVTQLMVLHNQQPALAFQISPGVPGLTAPYGTLSWPFYYTNYVLQSSSNIVSGWTAYTGSPAFVSGAFNSVQVGVTNKNVFYRLSLQP